MERASVVGGVVPGRRAVKTVPFVELGGGRVQGVISSGSDIERVYVAFFEARSGDFYCSTNNNRPCGGLGGSPCKHIGEMLKEACLEFEDSRVMEYLGLGPDAAGGLPAILAQLKGHQKKEPAGLIFSRFLDYLGFCEIRGGQGTVLEMGWFVQ